MREKVRLRGLDNRKIETLINWIVNNEYLYLAVVGLHKDIKRFGNQDHRVAAIIEGARDHYNEGAKEHEAEPLACITFEEMIQIRNYIRDQSDWD